jgi:hypothetical protein
LTEWSSELQTQAPASGLTMDHCASLMEIMTEWCTKMFGHQLNAKNIGFSGGAGTAQSNSTGTSNSKIFILVISFFIIVNVIPY